MHTREEAEIWSRRLKPGRRRLDTGYAEGFVVGEEGGDAAWSDAVPRCEGGVGGLGM